MSHNKLTNPTQLRLLINFINDNPDLAANRLNNTLNGKKRKNELWKKITTILNTNGPPLKSQSEWKKVWTDHKYNVKRKLVKKNKSISKTGGGPYENIELTEAEEVIASCSALEHQVNGLDVPSFGASSFRENQDVNDSEPNLEHEEDSNVEVEELSLTFTNLNENANESQKLHYKGNCTEKDKISLINQELEENKDFHIKILNVLNELKQSQHELNTTVKQLGDILSEKLELEKEEVRENRILKKRDLDLRAMELEVARTSNELKLMALNKNSK